MRREGGQALVFLLGIAAALAAAMLAAFHAGQLVNHKQRLLNTADAAAYSAAAWQARTLNLEAYVNRAIVANEVAIAQAVSLRSWSGYMRRLLDRADNVGQFVPYLGQAIRFLDRLWRSVDGTLQPTLSGAEATLSFSQQALAAAQSFVHAAGFVAARDLAAQTVQANDPRMRLSAGSEALFAARLAPWMSFTAAYAGRERQRQKRVIEASLDPFTVDRGFDLSPPIANLFARLRKRGGTDLIGFDTWRGIDTMALHMRRGFLGSMGERVSLGWGGAENGQPTRQIGWNGGSWRVNPRTSRNALRDARVARIYRGLPAMRDVADPWRRDERTLELAVAVASVPAAAVAAPALADARLAAPGGPLMSLTAALPREPLHAIAAAQVYFARPEPRADAHRELPSLFNPYWQVRLVPVSAHDRALAAAANGIADPFAALP